jgi:hypothetical protein
MQLDGTNFHRLVHFGHGVSMNNVKDMVNLFRARRTEDTQKGPVRYYEGPGRFAITPVKSNRAPLQIYVKEFSFETRMSRCLISTRSSVD